MIDSGFMYGYGFQQCSAFSAFMGMAFQEFSTFSGLMGMAFCKN